MKTTPLHRALLAFSCGLAACSDDGAGSADRADTSAEDTAADGASDELPISEDQLARLDEMGYASFGDEVETTGVVLHDRERAVPGLNLFTNVHTCTTQLMDMDGKVLHEWSHPECFRWANSVVLADGDLVVLGRTPLDRSVREEVSHARYAMRQSWEGETEWFHRIDSHHDLEVTPRGETLVLTYRHEVREDMHPTIPLQDQLLTVFTETGEIVREVSLYEVLSSDPNVFTLEPTPPRTFDTFDEIDAIHANSVEWVRETPRRGEHPLYADGNVLVCMRNQDAIAIFDWETERVLWSWGKGQLSGPHDATMLEDGNILVFDNGAAREWSRVVEIDPLTGKVVWEYHAKPKRSFFTRTRGASQKLSNGNVIVTESDAGRVFEVTPEGDVVWEFVNFNVAEVQKRSGTEQRPSVIVRMRRYEGMTFEDFEAAVRAGTLPRVD